MKKVKVLLMTVYNQDMLATCEELGICYITSYLRGMGYEVELMGVMERNLSYQQIVEINPDIVGMPVYDINRETTYNVSNNLKKLLPGWSLRLDPQSCHR